MKILVADDSTTNLNLITYSLNKLGHTVIPVNNGTLAVEKFKTEHPDLIILDVMMEGMDGFECALHIRKINPEDWVPIIFLSSAVDDESIAKGINAGGDDYLTKPFSDVTLAAKIKAMQRISDMRQALYQSTQQLQRLSTIDSLTNISNRLQFDRSIKEKIAHAKRNNSIVALLFIDLDNFKGVNDTLGHHIGDLLLVETAKRLLSCIRADDFIARMGGDEFALILTDVESTDAPLVLAKKIIHSLEKVFTLEKNDVYIGTSIGIAYFPTSATDEKALIQCADLAMYHAKTQGRNNYQPYTDDLSNQYKRHLLLDNELKNVLEKNELKIKYQPIYELITQKLIGAEALLTWKHPLHGEIGANTFLPLAEKIGMVNSISHWLLSQVCADIKKWDLIHPSTFKIAINTNATELTQKEFCHQLKNTLNAAKINPNFIQYEICNINNINIALEKAHDALTQIRQMGIDLIIDHFGTRSSSLTDITLLPINGIKIDSNILTTPNDEKNILATFINFGINLKLSINAEGIDTHEQLQKLIKLQCQNGQGSLLSLPLNPEEFSLLLEKSNLSNKELRKKASLS